MEQLPVDTPYLNKKAGAMRNEVDETFMSAPLKAELSARMDAIQKKGIEANKAVCPRGTSGSLSQLCKGST
jgi:hypothetical protein